MDIQTKDGILLRNIPDGTPDEEIKARIAKIRGAPAAEAPAVPAEAPAKPATNAELLAGSKTGRFALGVASPLLGLAQGMEDTVQRAPMALPAPITIPMLLAAEVRKRMGGPSADDVVKNVEAAKKRGMEAHGTEGFDWMGLAGSMVSPPVAKVASAIKAAPTALGRIAQGAALGGGVAAAQPVTEGDYAQEKPKQISEGAALGAVIPGGVEAGKGVYRGARDTLDLVLPGGAERIATRYQRNLVGQGNVDKVADALRSAPEHVPGAKPTAAEAVATLPEGSPIIAQQKITAATPGGVSAKFGQRSLDQKDAVAQAVAERAATTGPMREAALEQANAGGVKSEGVISGIDATLGKPGIRASDVVGKTLNSVKEKIAKFTDEATGVIDANDLYTIRKEIGNTIKTHAKETANWDKKLTAGLERDIQKSIDDAIESAGGAGWKDYLRTFSEKSQGMEADLARKKAMLKPAQRTNVGGGINVAEETRAHIPNMLSRPAMIANAILKLAAGKKVGVEPRVDAVMAEQYLNPARLAADLQDLPSAQRSKVVEALVRLGIVGGSTAAAQ